VDYTASVSGPWTAGNGVFAQTPNSISFIATTGSPVLPGYVAISYMRVLSEAINVNKFRAIVHPPPASTTYFAVYVQLCNPEFTVTTIDDTEVMDYPQTAQYAIVRETALDLAIILRRPDSTWDAIKSRLADSRELTDNIAARST
jgi:hypothetical protein